MDTILIFLLNTFFLEYSREKSKTGFFNLESPTGSVFNSKWRAKFQIYRFHKCDSDWLNFILFFRIQGYKIRFIVSILRKRDDQALISISTILKFSAQ